MCWFQRVKDKEFESNSQPSGVRFVNGCAGFSVSKIKNLKAIHNKPRARVLSSEAGFSVSKIKNLKAIHNHFRCRFLCLEGWFQRVKDKEFESNSQRLILLTKFLRAGFSVSKIKNLKAIHNSRYR